MEDLLVGVAVEVVSEAVIIGVEDLISTDIIIMVVEVVEIPSIHSLFW